MTGRLGSNVGRIWAAGLLFLLFIAAAILVPDLFWAGREPVGRLQELLAYVIQVGLWLSGAYFAISLINFFFWDRVVVAHIGRPAPRLLKDCLALVIWIATAAGIVGMVFGQSVTGIWATSGILGIVLGFALRNIIADVFTGLAVNIDQSYHIGDWVELLDRRQTPVFGKVIEINWRTTRIETDDRRVIVVPNSLMGSMAIANYSMPDHACRYEAIFSLNFSVPAAHALRVLQAGAKAACGTKGMLETPEPNVLVGGATAVGVEYRVRYWIDVDAVSPNSARHAIAHSVLAHLDHAGLPLAYPKQDTFLARMPVRQLEHRSEADRAKLLAGVDILAGLNSDELARLAGALTPRTIAAGSRVVAQGEQGASMFVLAEGLLEVWATKDGGEIKVGRIVPGEFYGEMSLLTDEPRTATVIAATEALAYEITRVHLMPILAERPELFEAISRLAAARRVRTSDRLASTEAPHEAEAVQSASARILGKMRLFFRTVAHGRAASGT